MSLAAVVSLLQAILVLLAVSQDPTVPQSVRDQSLEVASQTITQVSAMLSTGTVLPAATQSPPTSQPAQVIYIPAHVQTPVDNAPKPTCRLTITPASIVQGQNATLAWTSQNATEGTILFDIGVISSVTSGSKSISAGQTTNYLGMFTGTGGIAYCSAKITVAPAAQTTTTSAGGTSSSGSTSGAGGSCVYNGQSYAEGSRVQTGGCGPDQACASGPIYQYCHNGSWSSTNPNPPPSGGSCVYNGQTYAEGSRVQTGGCGPDQACASGPIYQYCHNDQWILQ
jgi:hypothetical protein